MNKGFSLIELLFVLGITSILALFSFPSYQNYIMRTHRVEGQTALLDLANRMEQYFAEQNTYQTASIGQNKTTDVLNTNKTSSGWYILSIVEATAATYTLQAALQTSQAIHDPICAKLTFNHLGEKGPSLSEERAQKNPAKQCW